KQATGPEPQHRHFETATQEADAVARLIAERVADGAWRYDDVAILVRSNADADQFLRSLNLRGVPWTFSGNAGLYGRPEVRLLIAFLRSVAHPDDSVSLHYVASSDVYQVPIVDLTKCATYADRKHRWLFDVLRAVPADLELSEEGGAAVGRLVADLQRFMELARETPTGELLYQFLADSGLMTRYAKAPAELEQEVQNVSKFFKRVKDASRVLRYDHVREFVNHLDALIEAGDDPAVAEADTDTPAVHVLTVHKAKGLEWPVVFLVNCVQNRFPSTRRSEPIEMPVGLIKDTLPAGHFARGLPAGLRGRVAQRGLSHARARGAAQARGDPGPHALLSRGGGLGRQAGGRGAGVRLRARAHPGAGAPGPGRRHARRPGDRRLQVERRDRAEEGRPAGAREPPAQDLRARLG